MTLSIKNPIRWIKFRTWYLFDLPIFIKENNFKKGLELGAKAGRSMFHVLRINKQLHYTGIDLWEGIQGEEFTNNKTNEIKCRKKLKRFNTRTQLIKGDAYYLSDTFKKESFDFIFYDLHSEHMDGFHSSVLKKYLSKIKKGGFLIGCDFRNFRVDLYALGFKESDFKPCEFKNKQSERLEYLVIK